MSKADPRPYWEKGPTETGPRDYCRHPGACTAIRNTPCQRCLGPNPRRNVEREEKMLDAMRAGMTQKAIAQQFGISQGRVQKLLAKAKREKSA